VESPPYVPVTVAEPATRPVNITEHEPAASMQLAPTVPTVEFDDANITVPVGVLEAVVVSVTEAVHVEVAATLIVPALQTILVEVLSFERGITVTVFEVPELVL
jgi:hypothetical protein